MKNSILIATSLTLGISAASSGSVRVNEVANAVAEERAAYRDELIHKVRVARGQLTDLQEQLSSAEEGHKGELAKAVGLDTLAIISGIMATAVAKNTAPRTKLQAAAEAVFIAGASISGLVGIKASTQATLSSMEVDRLQDLITKANYALINLELQLTAIDAK
jgi:hypothetical protein